MPTEDTSWLMMVDERVKVGYSSCGTATVKSFFQPKTRHIACAISAIPSIFKVGDVDDALASLAPRPFMESKGDQEFHEDFLERLYGKARERYKQLGVGDHFVTLTFPEGHEFPDPMKKKAYLWFDRWLRK